MQHTNWPNDEEVARLTAELIAQRATAPNEIAVAFLSPLAAYLRVKFPQADPDLSDEAAGSAILATVRGENHYDPGRGNLSVFLRMVAQGDFLNLLEKETRRKQRRIPLEFVEELAERRNTLTQDLDHPSLDDPGLVAELASFATAEQTMWELMLAGERDTEVCASAAGLTGTLAERKREVKRLKDRIKVRLRRAVGGKQ